MFFEYLKYFSIKGRLQLLYGSINYKLYKTVPKKIFEVRNLIEALKTDDVSISEEKHSFFLVKDNFKFSLRKGSSDFKVFQQIILKEEFKNVIKLINQNNIKIETVIDAGANIGLTTLYIKKHFSNAKVLCIEPDDTNHLQLLKHITLNNLASVEILKGGVWSHNNWLNIDYNFRDGLEWSRSLKPAKTGQGNIPVYSINNLLLDKQWNSIDFLKMDIEGAEEAIFSKSCDLSFLNKTKVITIEIHDMFEVGHRIVEILHEHNFKLYFSGELTIGIKK